MKSSRSELFNQLSQFNQEFIAQHQEKYQCLPQVALQEEWLSPCQQSIENDGFIQWQPVEITEPLSFNKIEDALGLTLHDDIKNYFTAFYSESIPANCSEGYLELLFAWNKDDFIRLQENIVGHVLMKRKLKQTPTIFFAVTDDDNVIVSMNNDTGAICAERVGKEPDKKLANSMSEFIHSLTVAL